ncbi:PEP-CTERM sorting domain-containing protein [bacterium]|nr:MAG: PEP-CTERM sorting domain-containing protein [bacterium]
MTKSLPILSLLAVASLSSAQSWSFELLHPAPTTAPAGQVIGWGYTVTNDSADRWLLLNSLQFAFDEPPAVDASSALFDYPLLAPGESRTRSFVWGVSGMFWLKFDDDTLPGDTCQGTPSLGGAWYDGDPSAAGNYLEPSSIIDQRFSATVQAVPEPASMMALALGAVNLLRRRKRA